MELKTRYQRISGRNDNKEAFHSNNIESDESGKDNMHVYGEFVGGIQIREVTSVTSD